MSEALFIMDTSLQMAFQSVASAIKQRQLSLSSGIGGSITQPFSVGLYATTAENGLALSTIALTANAITLIPFTPTVKMSMTDITFYVSTAVTGFVKIVVYDSSASTGAPNNRIYLGGNIVTTPAGHNGDIGLNITMEAGRLYYIGFHSSVAVTVRAAVTGGCQSLGIVTVSGTAHITKVVRALTFATTPPATWGTPAVGEYIAGSAPVFFLRWSVL